MQTPTSQPETSETPLTLAERRASTTTPGSNLVAG